MKKTSLNDIAQQLGVSKTLVSLVLNGKAKEQRISDEVCIKVINSAKELNYKPNQIAKGLRTGKTNTIDDEIIKMMPFSHEKDELAITPHCVWLFTKINIKRNA